jgi:DNA polymerase III alpha subunit
MKTDQFGVQYGTSDDLVRLLYQRPDADIANIPVADPDQYNAAVKSLWLDNMPTLIKYQLDDSITVEEFDSRNQSQWFMPKEYLDMDIAQWLLGQCKTPEQLQRVGEELLLYQDRDLFNLLRLLKYLVDVMRKNGVVWGVGRGSSVASYVLYLIGVHRVDSIYYDLPIEEFLK